MWPNLQETADLITFTEEILNGKHHFLCREYICWATFAGAQSEMFEGQGSYDQNREEALAHCIKNEFFSLRISSVNATKSAVCCGFDHVYWRNP